MDYLFDEKILSLAQEVITHTRNTLIVHLRYMDVALGRLTPVPFPRAPLATDGEMLYYNPIHILKIYQRSQEETARDYLHAVMHCVFRHFFVSPLLRKDLWNLACDIAVEAAIDDLDVPTTDAPRAAKQRAVKSALTDVLGPLTAEKLYRHYLNIEPSAEEIRALGALFRADDHEVWYIQPDPTGGGASGGDDPSDENEQSEKVKLYVEQEVRSNEDSDENNDEEGDQNGQKQSDADGAEGSDDENEQEREQSGSGKSQKEKDSDGGASDDENTTKGGGKGSGEQDSDGRQDDEQRDTPREALAQQWKEVAERIKEDLETFSQRHGSHAGNMMQSLREVTREKYDYTAFLKKFATLHEAMTINDEEFDYVYYTYGLRLYGKMPLVEPLEYKDVKRIRDFVIVIDTSGSVQGKEVQSFLQKTYNILKNEESFFVKFNLHIVQCDAEVQTDDKITSQEEFDEYIKTMRFRGFGGTDFRPAFEYVNKLIENHEFTNLKGLIYFTDGYGDYPKKKPPYEAAFVFVNEDDRVPEVPPWAIKLILRPEEI